MTDHLRSDRKGESAAGNPDRAGDENDTARRSRPSTRPVDEGLEGAILDPDVRPPQRPTGAGAEAAEGIVGARTDRSKQDSGAASAADDKPATNDDSRKKGSEPLEHRDTTHSSSYGGEMGEPRDAG